MHQDKTVKLGEEIDTLDNRWVVPYNAYLTKKYSAHINVEASKGVHAIKYSTRYFNKGSDRAILAKVIATMKSS